MPPLVPRVKQEVIIGDCFDVIPDLPIASFDLLLTDPPYSSGGMYRGDRNSGVAEKYLQSGSLKFSGHMFDSDRMDQRAWGEWCRQWLSLGRSVVRPGGFVLVFTDWRQLPTLTDAVQAAGWVWRGVVAWDKGPSAKAPGRHYFRHQCEYVVWGTNGPCPPKSGWPPDGEGMLPGCYTVSVGAKRHPTGKPVALMEGLMRCIPPRAKVLDPFCGSGSTLVAAKKTGRGAVGVEKHVDYAKIAEQWLGETR